MNGGRQPRRDEDVLWLVSLKENICCSHTSFVGS